MPEVYWTTTAKTSRKRWRFMRAALVHWPTRRHWRTWESPPSTKATATRPWRFLAGRWKLYAQAGAAWDAGRVRGRLRALGVRRRLVAVQRPARGWAAMTDSELAVARLVAQGLTNREVAERLFVSQHTVSGHLRHVFAKLDVNSRVELCRLADIHQPRP